MGLFKEWFTQSSPFDEVWMQAKSGCIVSTSNFSMSDVVVHFDPVKSGAFEHCDTWCVIITSDEDQKHDK